jgi:Ca-activated chloride channel family protein
MWRFEHPEFLWALVLLPVLGLLYRWRRTQQQHSEQQLGGLQRVQQLVPGYFAQRHLYQWSLLAAAFFFGIVALANLQSGLKTEKIKRKGIDVMLCLDLSNSMLATDLAPNRLERAKQWLNRLLNAMPNNRVGLIVFAGNAYVLVPLTTDHAALKMNLADTKPEQMPTQGTSLGEALAMARNRFNPEEARFKSIVLLSDGEDHEEAAISEAETCAKAGIAISTVGIGSPEGSRIPDQSNGGFKQDRDGRDVISVLNESILQQIAQVGKGTYVPINRTEAESVARTLNNTQQGTYSDIETTEYKSYFTVFAFLSLLCLLLEQNIETVFRKKTRRAYA